MNDADLSSYIPWNEESGEITSCGIPINYNASEEWANKKVVLFSVPGKLILTLPSRGRMLTCVCTKVPSPLPVP